MQPLAKEKEDPAFSLFLQKDKNWLYLPVADYKAHSSLLKQLSYVDI